MYINQQDLAAMANVPARPALKLLLLGSKGQLGQAFCHSKYWPDWHSLALSRDQLDITDTAALEALFALFIPDIVINCVAYTKVALAEHEAEVCMAINVNATARLAQLCQRYNSLLVHFSSDYVFDGQKNSRYHETDKPKPLNVYGQAKLLSEQAVIKHCEKHLIFRTSWLFSQFGNNFYLTMLKLAQQAAAIKVVDNERGCPTYAGALADATLCVLKQYTDKQTANSSFPFGLYHFASQDELSWYQFALEIFAANKLKPSVTAITAAMWPENVLRPSNSALSSEHFQTTFNIAIPSLNATLALLAEKGGKIVN